MIDKKKNITPQQAIIRLENLCARSEHSSGEIRRKMMTWGMTSSDINNIIASLMERRYIDDRRFCEAFVRDKVEFGSWGRRKIMLALRQKDVDMDVANDILASIDEDRYFDRLIKIVRTKARTINDCDSYEGRAKLMRFAVSRGFEPSLVAKAITRLGESDD